MGAGFKERMEFIAKSVGNASVLAKQCNISRRSISLYLSGESDPSRERLITLAKVAGVRLEWLATGQEPIWKNKLTLAASEQDRFIRIPILAAAEPNTAGGEKSEDCLYWQSKFFDGLTEKDKLLIVHCNDAGMSPSIKQGDMVLISTIVDKRNIQPEGCYAFVRAGNIFFRKVQILAGGGYILLSENKSYQPERIDEEEIKSLYIFGKAVLVIQNL